MKFLKFHFLRMLPVLLLASCSSTDVIDTLPGVGEGASIISISLSAPQITSRADASHKLRYTARLFKGNTDTESIEPLQKKQVIEGDASTTLVFEGVEEGTYTITLFADYIPADSQPDSNGLYPDCYYDTSQNEDVEMKRVDSSIINNDHYDCFGKYLVVKKGADELHQTVALPRIVSKVRFKEEEETASGVVAQSVEITRFSNLMKYRLTSGRASSFYNYPDSKVSGGKWTITPSDASSGELFYFYTFATDPVINGSVQTLQHFSFSVAADGIESLLTDIGTGEVEVKPNFITTLLGNFIPTPEEDPETRTDRITLDLTSITGWSN